MSCDTFVRMKDEPTIITTVTTFKCPLCSGFMSSFAINKGVILRCDNSCLPTCHENVYGYGSTEKAAHEIACQKYKRK